MLKVNKLDQFIKKSTPLYWAVKEEYNYIANEFSIMKIKDIPEQINFRMLSIFKETPENNGAALKYCDFGVAEDNAVLKLLENVENCNTVSAIDTELVWATVEIRKTKGVRIFKAGNKAVYIPVEIMELLSDYSECVYGDSWIQFKKENEWLLTMKTAATEKNEFIK